MNQYLFNDNVFIRSMGSRGDLGGLTKKAQEVGDVLAASGKDIIIYETVGVGQSETTVSNLVDFFLLLMLAGAGDELQGIKRGIMEIADMLVISKADGDNTQKSENAKLEYQRALHLFLKTYLLLIWSPL